MPKIDGYSRATVPIEQRFRDLHLGTATAFVWVQNDVHYLITNWHVATMVDPNTGRNLHDQAARPDAFRAQFNTQQLIWEKVSKDVPLYDNDERPLWLVHPVYRRKVDVIALPLAPPDKGTDYCPINRLSRESELLLAIGMDVFVLGYPFGAEAPGFPVWKRGSIASEPELAPLTNNYFLVDTSSRPGMSGGPVIRRSWGIHVKEQDAVSMTGGSETKFVGVYSGRLKTKDPLEVQLGMAWPAALISEIIMGNTRDEPF